MEPEIQHFNKLPGDVHAAGPKSKELEENLHFMGRTAKEGNASMSTLVLRGAINKGSLF